VGARLVNDKLSSMRSSTVDDDACTCEGECVCDEVKAMMSELDDIRVIQKGFRATPDVFAVGPGASVGTGEAMVNIYFFKDGVDHTLSEEPAMTIGLPKASAAKLMWGLTETAKQLGWLENNDE
jgi:hypothetical protein